MTKARDLANVVSAGGGLFTSQVDLVEQGDLRLQDTTGGQYVALQAPGTVSSSFTLTLPAADGTSGQFLKTDGSGVLSFETVSSSVQYPQESKSADYTLVLADAGKQIFHPASDKNIRTFTIPANSSVAFPIGTVVLFVAENSGLPINVAITSDTLVTNRFYTETVAVNPGNTLYCIKVGATKWLGYYLNEITNPISTQENIASAAISSPYVQVYPISPSGFGTKYSNPSTLPNGAGRTIAFNNQANALAVGHDTGVFLSVYAWSPFGFGSRYSNAASTAPGAPNSSGGPGLAFSPNDTALVGSFGTSSPYVHGWPWSSAGGFGVKYADPATAVTGLARGVSFHPDNNAIAIAHQSDPRITVYAWSSSGFGSKFSNPSSAATVGIGRGVAFSPAGDAIALAGFSSPYIDAWAWSGSGFGSKFSNPATLPPGDCFGVAFSPDASAIGVVSSSSPYVHVYGWSASGFGSKFANPATLPAGAGESIAFSKIGNLLAVGHNTSPFLTVYPWSGSGFGTKLSNPSSLPVSAATNIDFSLPL